jgi:hypothetical protein
MQEYMQFHTTVDSVGEAERLGRSITSARLAACIKIVWPLQVGLYTRLCGFWPPAMEDGDRLLAAWTPTEIVTRSLSPRTHGATRRVDGSARRRSVLQS